MTGRWRHGGAALLVRQAKTDAALEAILATVVALAVFLVAAGQGALAAVADQELRHTLGGFSAARHDLAATASFASGGTFDAHERFASITSTLDDVVSAATPPLAAALGRPDWAVATVRETAVSRDDPNPQIVLSVGLAAAPDWLEHVRFVEGSAPAAWRGSDTAVEALGARMPVPVALSRAVAEQLNVRVGDVLDADPWSVLVTGLYEPADSADAFWAHLPRLRDPARGKADDGRIRYTADALIDPGSTSGLKRASVTARITAWYPLRIDEMSFADAPLIAHRIRQLSAGGVVLGSGERVQFSTQVADDLDAVTDRVSAATALFALLVAGPLGVVLAVLALSAGALAERRSGAFALARVRGGSGSQLRIAMLVEGAVLSVPAAAVGLVLAFAVTGGRTPVQALWPAALLACIPPLLLAFSVPPLARRTGPSGRRWVIEVLVAGLAAASLFLLFERGLTPSAAGIDPLLVLCPLLVAAAVTIGVLRVYPWLMRAAHRSARRGRGAVALVGSAGAVRAPSLGFAAAFALIVGVSVAVFSAGMAATLAGAIGAAPASAGRESSPLDPGHPLVAGIFWLLAAAAAVPLLLCVIAVVMSLITAANRRNSAVGVLRVMGFSSSQVRGLVAWELVPVSLVAIFAGIVLGVGEVFVLSAAIDVSGFVGGGAAPRIDTAMTAAIALAFAVATWVAAAIATALAQRRSPGSMIGWGTE